MKKLQSLLLAVLLVAGIFVGVTTAGKDLLAESSVYWGDDKEVYIPGFPFPVGSYCDINDPIERCCVVVAN